MRVEFINKHTGGRMFVDETRAAEYDALGHARASAVIAEVQPVEIVGNKKKRTAKKAAKE